MREWQIAVFFLFTQLLDVVSTYIGITHAGLVEYNPLVQWWFEAAGVPQTLVFKLAVAGLLAFIYLKSVRWRRAIEYSLVASSMVVWLIGFSNILLTLSAWGLVVLF